MFFLLFEIIPRKYKITLIEESNECLLLLLNVINGVVSISFGVFESKSIPLCAQIFLMKITVF